MSSGQKRRTPVNFPKMKDRAGARRRRRQARADATRVHEAMSVFNAFAQIAAGAMRAFGEMVEDVGRSIAAAFPAERPDAQKDDYALAGDEVPR